MKYEQTFREYVAKWILTVLYTEKEEKFSLEQLNEYFQNCLRKGEEIYSEFAHFGLYLFEDKGINFVLDELIHENLIDLTNEKVLEITEKGIYAYEEFYSGQLLEDVLDPFDFFFEHDYDLEKIFRRKREVLKNF